MRKSAEEWETRFPGVPICVDFLWLARRHFFLRPRLRRAWPSPSAGTHHRRLPWPPRGEQLGDGLGLVQIGRLALGAVLHHLRQLGVNGQMRHRCAALEGPVRLVERLLGQEATGVEFGFDAARSFGSLARNSVRR